MTLPHRTNQVVYNKKYIQGLVIILQLILPCQFLGVQLQRDNSVVDED